MQACTDVDEKFGHLGCLTTSPGLTRSSGQSILLEPGKWFAFLSKSPQRGRDGTHGNEVGTLRRTDRQTDGRTDRRTDGLTD